MKESKFIEQNKDKWLEFEGCLKNKDEDPEKISRLFVQITDDLAYSRTFYPKRSIRAYLNGLARHVFIEIYKNKKNTKGGFAYFWTVDLPHIMYGARKQLSLSFVIFLFSVLIGIFSSMNEPDFARHILGDEYVDMTEENIKNNDPMAVYKKMNNVDMFFGITLNNMKVAFYTFVSGIFLSIGSIGVLLYNGIMLGTFQFFFIERGIFTESFLTIWQHGTLEISAIIIAGAAGIVMGNGILFPGTYSRLYSLRMSAKKGLKIMLGISPIIITAGFIEGFFTRHTSAPTFIRLFVILASLIFVFYYFVFYPRKVAKTREIEEEKPVLLNNKNSNEFSANEIYSTNEIFSYTFQKLFRNIQKVLLFIFGSSLIYTGIIVLYYKFFHYDIRTFAENYTYDSKFMQLDYNGDPILFIINSLVLISSVLVINKLFISNNSSNSSSIITRALNLSIPVIVINASFLLEKKYGTAFSLLIFPLIITITLQYLYGKKDIFNSFVHTLSLLRGQYARIFGVYIRILIISAFFMVLLNTPVFKQLLQTINWGFYFEKEDTLIVFSLISLFINTVIIYFFITVLFFSSQLNMFSIKEIKNADYLKSRIQNIGRNKNNS